MIRLDKKLVDDLIRLTMKYYKTGDTDYLPSRNGIRKVLEESVSWRVVYLIEDLAKYTRTSGKETYDDIYKALAVFGIIVEDKELLEGE